MQTDSSTSMASVRQLQPRQELKANRVPRSDPRHRPHRRCQLGVSLQYRQAGADCGRSARFLPHVASTCCNRSVARWPKRTTTASYIAMEARDASLALTQAGDILGSPAYSAPETALGEGCATGSIESMRHGYPDGPRCAHPAVPCEGSTEPAVERYRDLTPALRASGR